jgi:hypothetical protein
MFWTETKMQLAVVGKELPIPPSLISSRVCDVKSKPGHDENTLKNRGKTMIQRSMK